MTIAELRKHMEHLPDDAEVLIHYHAVLPFDGQLTYDAYRVRSRYVLPPDPSADCGRREDPPHVQQAAEFTRRGVLVLSVN